MTNTAQGKRKLNQTKTNQKEKGKTNMTPTMQNDEVDFNDAEDFKLPSAGVHTGNLVGVELTQTKKNENKDQFVLTVALSPEDPDAPNLPMRKYLGWPLPEEKEIFWGSRTAYGAQVQALKETMTAFGGNESGPNKKADIMAFLISKVGMAVKVKIKLEQRTDPVTKEPVDPPEWQANVDKLLPA